MKIIISGAKVIGSHLARLLSRNNADVTIIDEDANRLDQLRSNIDVLTVQGEACDLKIMREAEVHKADLFIAVTTDENKNIQACMMAKGLGAKKTIAKVDDKQYIEPEARALYERLGVSSIVYPELLAGKDIANGLKMSWVRERWDIHDGALVMLGIKLREECQVLNRPLRELCGPDDPYHIVAIKRHGETILPGGDDTLQLYDLAYFMTTKPYIAEIRRIVGKEQYADVKNVMIMGGGKTAVRTVKELPTYMHVKIFEQDEHRCEELNDLLGTREKLLIINGDARDLSLLSDEGIGNTHAFVAVTGNAESNILTCLAAKRLGVRKTVAVVEDLDYVSMAESLDIGTIINKKGIAAASIYQKLLEANVLNVRFITTANADVAEFIVSEGSMLTKKDVKDLSLPRGMTIGGIIRNEQGLLVSGNTRIQVGDCVVVFAHGIDIKRVEKLF